MISALNRTRNMAFGLLITIENATHPKVIKKMFNIAHQMNVEIQRPDKGVQVAGGDVQVAKFTSSLVEEGLLEHNSSDRLYRGEHVLYANRLILSTYR